MSGFKALNLESDDESDIEVDDTKELQIEDALKLYQIALKYHAEGLDSFDLAAEAYEELFKSEIFQYPESQTELRRIELYGATSETEDLWDGGAQAGPVVGSAGLDSGPSTLPQILHLSHKNYAQFKLEHLDARLQYLNYSLSQILQDASVALEHFVQALDKDDSDTDLWRRTATVGGLLDSKRVARFCLEAVLDGDDEGLGSVLALPGLDEGLAAEQLQNVVGQLQDELSALQAPLPAGKKRMLSKMLKQRLNPYVEIETRRRLLQSRDAPKATPLPMSVVLKTPKTWAELGNALLERQKDEHSGAGPKDAGVRISFNNDSILALTAGDHGPSTGKETAQNPSAPLKQSDQGETAGEQSPGSGNGQTPAPQQKAFTQDEAQNQANASKGIDVDMDEAATISLPTRKRSVDAAGLGDATEEGRTKSKRTRTRESGIGEEGRQTLEDANRRWEQDQKLGEMQAADDWMFETVGNLFERIGVVGFEAGKDVRQELQNSDSDSDNAAESDHTTRGALQIAKVDLQACLIKFSNKLAQILTAPGDQLDSAQSSGKSGFGGTSTTSGASRNMANRISAMPDDGLHALLHGIQEDRLLLDEVACMWVRDLLQPTPSETSRYDNSYAEYQWSEDLKTMVVRVLVNFDEPVFNYTAAGLQSLDTNGGDVVAIDRWAGMAQTIFELHLDVYCLIKQPNSGVDLDTIASQKDRLFRWSELAREAMHVRAIRSSDDFDPKDELNLRFLWATTFNIGASDDATQEHIIDTMQDLRAMFVGAEDTVIQLQNNAVMPELSMPALDREISRLTTKDFFLKVTNQDVSDPVAVIESLEPLLAALDEESPQSEFETDESKSPSSTTSVSSDLVRFLRSSDSSIRLMLWIRLRDAYLAIDYKPMVVSCYVKILRMLLKELTTGVANVTSQPDRQMMIVKTLRQARIVVKKVFELIQGSEIAFECIDEDGLKSAVSSLGQVLQLTQVFNVFEDLIRVEQVEAPKGSNGGDNAAFISALKVIHEMQVHTWIILYRLFEEAIFQFHDLYPTPAEDRFDFLRTVHRNLGLRHMCGDSNRAFVQLLINEFFQMTHVDGYDSEQSQVLYDLYGINCFLNPSYELIEHYCTRDAFIDRGVAMQAVDLLIQQASKLPMKDLIKHTLKDTIDKVHGSAPRKKPTDAILRNREIYRTFLRSPINPLDLYSCLKGEGNELDVSPVPKEDAVLASKGWYFLMGHIALAKFRSVKRTGPTPTEDVDIAVAFFNQDLEYSGENWETWFRLAQAYDTKIEESVVWSAEKLNSSMLDIVQLQRAAIHCYTMATALAYRSADLRFETSEKMTELFTDFAMRIYASSREPFGMKPFELEDADKFLSYTRGVARGKPFQPLRPFTAWKVAKSLYQRALIGKPQSWHLHYMLGKCLWKMHVATNLGSRDKRPTAQQVLQSFISAIEFVPDANKRDSREKREPVLEPHYKLVSIVHKLMFKGHITLPEAQEALSNTPYARTATFPSDHNEWVPHILAIVKNLRAADKSNWHHRMIARAAHIIYEDADPRVGGVAEVNNLGATGARHELTQQMFTKTMVLQVWRPECERAGRHFVYTARYTRFFVRILEQLKDRANLEMLAKRVRRRPHDLFEHASVWQDICNAYLRLLRSHASLPEGLETSTFSNIAHEDFLSRKEPLEKWMQTQETGHSPALDVLREVQELKKINQSLMKPGPIDDLIGDSYAYLFNTTGKQLWDEERRIKQEGEARKPPPAASPTRNPMMSLTHLMNIDGASDAPPSQPQAAAPAAPLPTEQSVRRKIGVGRREIRTTAEACFQKSRPAATGHEITYKGPLSRVQVVVDNSRVERLGDMSVETSAPGSVHDSADDESELSELEVEGEEDEGEEEIKPRPLFPGLVSEGQSRQGSEGFETAEEGEGEEGSEDGANVDVGGLERAGDDDGGEGKMED